MMIAKKEFDLNKLYAGIASDNIGSRSSRKNGFVIEGTRKQHLFYGGDFFDQVDYGLILKVRNFLTFLYFFCFSIISDNHLSMLSD